MFNMAMTLDPFIGKVLDLFADFVRSDFVKEKVITALGVKDEILKLQVRMTSIRSLLKDAEKWKFGDSSSELWLSQLKDVMYDVDDIIDLCKIEGAQLLADQNPKSETSQVSLNFLSREIQKISTGYGIGSRIKKVNDRLDGIWENREQFKLEKSTISETPKITRVDFRQTCPVTDPFVVGREVEVAAGRLVDRLVGEKVDEKCRLFAVTGMGGAGKTTLAQKIFNHPKIKTFFNLDPVWVCVSQTYSEIELLKQVIRGAKGSYQWDAKSKSELQPILRDSVASGRSFFLVLDDVWRADVWVDLLRVPLCNPDVNVRVLVTTRYENVATEMGAAYIHPVELLSEESSWEMLRKRLFSEGEVELANDLKKQGLEIVRRCGCLPLAIKAISGVLAKRERSRKEWEKVLRNNAWSTSKLPEGLSAALYLSFEDLPSHLKQCFPYFSLYPEDAELDRSKFVRLWVAEGFVNEQENLLMDDSAEEYFDELLKRNLLLPLSERFCKMHDLVRSLAIFLSEGETSFGDLNVRNSTTAVKLRRLSVIGQKAAVEMLDSVADKGALRTLLASSSDLLLDDERLRRLSHLRVLDLSRTKIEILPDSIGNLVHLRYLNLEWTQISAIPESIGKLTKLQFLNISQCRGLRQLPSGITQLHNLRFLDLKGTNVSYIPQGIEKLQQLNYLNGFVVANNESSSKLEELSSLKQLRTLSIDNLKRAQSGTMILKELSYLSTLALEFFVDCSIRNRQQQAAVGQQQLAVEEQQLAVEEFFDAMIPPKSLEEFSINYFFGRRFPNWMALSSFENYVPYLTKLEFFQISSCSQLPPLGQLPQLRELNIYIVDKVRKIGPEFLGGGVNSIAFPKLEILVILYMEELEEWSFGAQVEENASPPRLQLLPCLQKLHISYCPLLKQLPKGLKYSAMKSLLINEAQNLKSVNDLPTEIEKLLINNCKNLEMVNCPPTLKELDIRSCKALVLVEKLDSLQLLYLYDPYMKSLPEWLLILLRERRLQNDINDNFQFKMHCNKKVLQKCIKGGIYWGLIQHIPLVSVQTYMTVFNNYLR